MQCLCHQHENLSSKKLGHFFYVYAWERKRMHDIYYETIVIQQSFLTRLDGQQKSDLSKTLMQDVSDFRSDQAKYMMVRRPRSSRKCRSRREQVTFFVVVSGSTLATTVLLNSSMISWLYFSVAPLGVQSFAEIKEDGELQ